MNIHPWLLCHVKVFERESVKKQPIGQRVAGYGLLPSDLSKALVVIAVESAEIRSPHITDSSEYSLVRELARIADMAIRKIDQVHQVTNATTAHPNQQVRVGRIIEELL